MVVSVLLTSCASENLDVPNQDPSLVKAKKWFEASKPFLEVLDYTNSIDWNSAIITNGIVGTVVEVPLILKENTTTNIGDNGPYKTSIRLMFIEDKKDIFKLYDVIYSSKDTLFNYKNLNFYNIDPNYSGFITLHNANNLIIDSKKYNNGEIIMIPKKSSATEKWLCKFIISVSLVGTTGAYSACSSYIWVPDIPNCVICESPNFALVISGGYGGGGGSTSAGGTSTGPASGTKAACYYSLNNITSQAFVASRLLSAITTSANNNTRTKQYKWNIFNCLGYSLFSYETGAHKKVTNADPSLQWEWVSLTHNNIASSGMVVGVSMSYMDISNLATIGSYNAIMNLNYSVKFSLACLGSPITNEFSFPSNHIFNVND